MSDTPDSDLDSLAPPSAPKTSWTYRIVQVLFALGIVTTLWAMSFPAVRQNREAARRSQCKNNLKQIGMALQNYHDTYGALPPAYMPDKNGRPLHSWRTMILPFLDQFALYNTIDMSKPWDDPVNAKAYATRVSVYECPSSQVPATHTTYLAVVTPNSIIRPGAPRRYSDITDGRSNTLQAIEVPQDRAVHWMSPQDADENPVLSIGKEAKLDHVGGMHALFGDGTMRFLSVNLAADTRRALMSASGNETVGEF